MWYIILTIIILICAAVIFWIGRKKIEKVRAVRVDGILKEKQAEIKNRLLELKLEKKFSAWGQSFLTGLKNSLVKTKGIVKSVKVRHKPAIGFKYGRAFKGKKIKTEITEESILAGKLLEAEVLLKKRQLDEAEDKFIEVLQADHKNIKAYMGLGEIYTLRKDWQTAEEAYRYITKINNRFFEGYKKLADNWQTIKRWDELKKLCQEVLDLGNQEAWVYIKLGLVYKKTGYPEKAEEYFKQAVELEPRSEYLLDSLLEVAIINKNKQLAQKAFNTLSGISRDEIKLQGYRDKIDLL